MIFSYEHGVPALGDVTNVHSAQKAENLYPIFYTRCCDIWFLFVSKHCFLCPDAITYCHFLRWGAILLLNISPLFLVKSLNGMLLAYTHHSPPLSHKFLLIFQSPSVLISWESLYFFTNICQIPSNIFPGTAFFFFLMFVFSFFLKGIWRYFYAQ